MTDERSPGWSREAGVAIVVFALTAAVFTWPLVARLASDIPTGGSPPTVALFNLFSTEWTAQALSGGPYWDAPMFHPHRGTFAWSETQPFTGLLAWAASTVVGATAAYNLVLLLYLVLTGLAGYALARQLTDDRVAALWAGSWLTAGAFPIHQLGVLHLAAAAFPIACLACFLALARRPDAAGPAWIAGAMYLLTLLTCAQYGLMLTMMLPLFVLPLMPWRSWFRPQGIKILGPTVLGLLVGLPLLWMQRGRLAEMGFERSILDVRGAYGLTDLILPARGHWLTTRVLGLSEMPGAYPWDLGVVLLAVTVVGAFYGAFRLRGQDRKRARAWGGLVLGGSVALLLGFGLSLGVQGGGEAIGPYAWLRTVVPGLSGVRTPSRFGLFAIVGLAGLAAVSFASLRQRASSRGWRSTVTVVGLVLLLAEMWAMPVSTVRVGRGATGHEDVVAWLERQDDVPLLELPLAQGNDEAALEREMWAVRRALIHGHPVANGYSGYFPETYRQLRDALEGDPAGRGRRYVDALGVRLVLLHGHDLESRRAEALVDALGGRTVFERDGDRVIRLDGAPVPAQSVRPESSREFRNRPGKGTVLVVPVEPQTDRARLFLATEGQRLEASWRDAAGRMHAMSVRLRGSVLVDAGDSWLHAIVQEVDGDAANAVLISRERLAALAGR